MKWHDPLLFLAGSRAAILRIGSSWWALLVAALLVVSAGVARNYDHLSLRHEWEWLYGPFGASLASSLAVALFGCGTMMFDRRNRMTYFSFLTFYWMTAPCAWLYGIPVEAFTDLVTATKWNVFFLAAVSVWRVALMVRVLVVVTGEPAWLSLGRILFPAAFVAMLGAFSLIPIMGGVRVPPEEKIIHQAASFTVTASFWLCLLGLLLMVAGLFRKSKERRAFPWRKVARPTGALAFALLCVGAWLAASAPLQVKVTRNYRLKELVRKEDFKGAAAYASRFAKDDFSRIHYLPPSPTEREGRFLEDLIKALDGSEPAWLREEWKANLEILKTRYPDFHDPFAEPGEAPAEAPQPGKAEG